MDSKKDNITPARVIGLWEEDLRNLTRLQHAWNHIRNFCIVLEVCEVIRFFAMPGYYWICWTTRIKGRPRSDGECAETPLSMGHFRIASSLHFKTRLHRSFFSHDVTISIFGVQNNGMADRTFFSSEQFAWSLIMRVKTIHITNASRL